MVLAARRLTAAIACCLLVAGCGADIGDASGPAIPAMTNAPATNAPATNAPTTGPPPTVVPTSEPLTPSTALLSAPCAERAGHVDALTFHSTVLESNQPDQRVLVYTPPCYQRDTTVSYPVVYLLHGAQTDEHQWEQIGIFPAADRLINAGTIPPMIIVLPDAIWAMGSYDGEPPLLDRLMQNELFPTIERRYRLRDDRSARAIGGISRGGEWALILAGRHPDQYAAVGGHSPAVGLPSTPNSYLVALLATPTPPPPAARARTPRIWLDVGTGDGLLGPVTTLDQGLTEAGVAHETHANPGGHDRAYWGSQIDNYLRFYGETFEGDTLAGQP